ncbi:hypothetical protein OJAV_G00093540 [Oryzias javanicus]|uniref:Armadillo repeat protein deleted in velo-cardio-facial syndrome n=1 Tax=Oryzias javanicus TaxID=123683 RepID=A0A437D0R6_ORYJA|nr:hypothetical protein OJAV_G00093540 [Oryzias javanicus]
MGDYDVRSAASILASVKEQEARFEQLTRALEEERRNVTLQLERSNLPPNPPTSQPLAWQQVVMQVIDASMLANSHPVQPRLFVPVYLSVLLLKVTAPHHYWDSAKFSFDTFSYCLYEMKCFLVSPLLKLTEGIQSLILSLPPPPL